MNIRVQINIRRDEGADFSKSFVEAALRRSLSVDFYLFARFV